MSLTKQYDDWHRRLFDLAPEHMDEHSPWYDLVLDYLVPIEGKRVLEIACGRGGFSMLLASKGAEMFGTDFSNAALQIAQRKIKACKASPKVMFVRADAQQLPYADESFDVVISCETIEHLPNPHLAVKEMARVCRRDGVLYLTTPNYFNAMGLYLVYARLRRRRPTPGSDQPLDRVFFFPEIRRMVRHAGWTIMCSDGTVHQIPLPGRNPVRVFFLEQIPALRRFLAIFALHQFLMAKKRAE